MTYQFSTGFVQVMKTMSLNKISAENLNTWVFLVLSLGVARDCWAVSSAQSKIVSAHAGAVYYVQGEVVYHEHNRDETMLLRPGDRLDEGDIVLTLNDASAEWSLTPDSFLKVSGNSLICVHTVALERMDFDLERGEIMIVIKMHANRTSLLLHTPPALLTIREPGRYLVRVLENKETEVLVGEGEVQYLNKQGKTDRVKKGRKVNFIKIQKNDEPQQH